MLLSEVKKLLWQSACPLFHIGQGVRIAAAEEVFFRLIESLRIPFVTARNANDMCDSSHPLYIGRPGTFAQRGANFAVQSCDLYIAIGTRLSLTQTGYNSKDYARNARILQVDIDQAELDKGTLRDPISICMNALAFLEEFERELHASPEWTQGSICARWVQWEPWLKRCQDWKRRYPVVLPEYQEQKGSVNSYYFVDVLSDLAQPDDVIITDMGFAFQNTHQAWKVKKGQRLMTNCGLAPMGWGLPAAVGACIGLGRRTILITGDGGLMMNIQELATVMHHKLNIKIFVLNNGGYLTIKQTQQLGFEGRLMGVNQDTGLSFPDFRRLAESFGMRKNILRTHEFIIHQLFGALNHEGPYLCEVMMSADQPQAPRSINRRNPDGTMNPTKLEDAFPFLPPEVIEQEMRPP